MKRIFIIFWLGVLGFAFGGASAAVFDKSTNALINPLINEEINNWQRVGPVQARLFLAQSPSLSLAASPRVSPIPVVNLALELKMDVGWHTYAQDPGTSGIRPRFDWAGSAPLKPLAPIFAPPMRFSDAGGDYFGYAGTTIIILPFMPLEPPKNQTDRQKIHIKLGVDIGVCRNVCLPARFDFALLADLAALNIQP